MVKGCLCIGSTKKQVELGEDEARFQTLEVAFCIFPETPLFLLLPGRRLSCSRILSIVCDIFSAPT